MQVVFGAYIVSRRSKIHVLVEFGVVEARMVTTCAQTPRSLDLRGCDSRVDVAVVEPESLAAAYGRWL